MRMNTDEVLAIKKVKTPNCEKVSKDQGKRKHDRYRQGEKCAKSKHSDQIPTSSDEWRS